MDEEKKKKLRAAGYKVGSAAEFLDGGTTTDLLENVFIAARRIANRVETEATGRYDNVGLLDDADVLAGAMARYDKAIVNAAIEALETANLPRCNGRYVDFQGAGRFCIPGAEGCHLQGCLSDHPPSGGY